MGSELVSDKTKFDRYGLFLKEKPKSCLRKSLITTQPPSGKSPFNPRQRIHFIEPLDENDPNYHPVKVFLGDSQRSVTVIASKENTIDELIKHIYFMCISDAKEFSDIRLPYKTTEGYELRLVDDEQPIYEIDPLERSKQLQEYNIDVVAFCAKQKYQYTTPTKHRLSSVQTIIIQGMILIKVHLFINKEKLTLNIQSEQEQQLKDVFDKIAKKRGLIRKPEMYKFLEYSSMTNYEETTKTLLKYRDYLNMKVLSMEMKIKDLKVSEIVLLQRYYADIPESIPRPVNITPPTETESPQLLKSQQAEWEALLVSDGHDSNFLENAQYIPCDYHVFLSTR